MCDSNDPTGELLVLFPLDVPRGRDMFSERITLTSVSPSGIPIDDLTRLIGAPCWVWFRIEQILEVVPGGVSVGFCDGQVYDFISKNFAKA